MAKKKGPIKLHVRGADPYRRFLLAVARKAPKVSAGALYRMAEKIMAKSKELAPVLTGALRASGFVELPKIRGGRISVRLGFGGPAVPYARRQHEEHKTNKKYLERPMMAARRTWGRDLARETLVGLGVPRQRIRNR